MASGFAGPGFDLAGYPWRSLGDDVRTGRITDARIDVHGQHASDTEALAKPLRDPKTYHLAIRVAAERAYP